MCIRDSSKRVQELEERLDRLEKREAESLAHTDQVSKKSENNRIDQVLDGVIRNGQAAKRQGKSKNRQIDG